MSLPGCEQRALDLIASQLRAGEPRLTSMFAIFARLEEGDGGPEPESIGTGRLRAWQEWLRRLPGRGRRAAARRRTRTRLLRSGGRHRTPGIRRADGRPAPVVRAIALVQLVIMIVISAVLLGLSRPAGRGCASVQPVHVWRAVTARHGRACPPPRREGAVGLGARRARAAAPGATGGLIRLPEGRWT